MTSFLLFLAGDAVGVLATIPVVRGLLRRGEIRAREAERRARRSERLAELGSMTSGLAHEIKNPLSTVGLNAQLLAEGIRDAEIESDDKERLLRRIDALARETERLRAILEDFLRFAGRLKLDPQPHDLVRIVDEVADFYHPQCESHGVVLRTDLPDDTVMARVDEGHFKQALLNLMINATQAMADHAPRDGADGPHARRGDLILRVEPGEDRSSVHVIDTGPGIEAAQLDEIFHPYVSHKRAGTGLGLPTARRIIEEHGGRLRAVSEPGRGSDFIIELPHATADVPNPDES